LVFRQTCSSERRGCRETETPFGLDDFAIAPITPPHRTQGRVDAQESVKTGSRRADTDEQNERFSVIMDD